MYHDKKKKQGVNLDQQEEMNTYGFGTMATPEAFPELKPFEDDLIALIGSIETRYAGNSLQDRMKEDLQTINNMTDELIGSIFENKSKISLLYGP